MKKFVLLSAVAVALGFAANKTVASSTMALSVSGTAVFNLTNYTTSAGVQHGTTVTKSFNNATIYNLISNGVANAANGLVATLPANGYIVFSDSSDLGPEYGTGYFYVTNKAGFFYPLSGFDNINNYYSFMELDSVTADFVLGGLGFVDTYYTDFDESDSFTYNENTGAGSVQSTSTALLLIHNDPYNYNDEDNSYEYSINSEAIEIRGILKVKATYTNSQISNLSASLTGTGNIETGLGYGEITSGTAKF